MMRRRPRKIIKSIENITGKKKLGIPSISGMGGGVKKYLGLPSTASVNFMDSFVLAGFWFRAVFLTVHGGSPMTTCVRILPLVKGPLGMNKCIFHPKMVGNTSLLI